MTSGSADQEPEVRVDDQLRKLVTASLDDLETWVDRNGLAGFDPYDFEEWFHFKAGSLASKPIFFGKSFKRLARRATWRRPERVWKFLGFQKRVIPKALGLMMEGESLRYETTGKEDCLERAVAYGDWLLDHPAKGIEGLAWGYPFDWNSRMVIPKGTPGITVTAEITKGFERLSRATGEARHEEAFFRTVEFVEKDLRRAEQSDGTLCFSYTPIDNYEVHNANLMAAEVLAMGGRRFERTDWLELARRSADFTVSQFRDGRYLSYWSDRQEENETYDCYHSGFEIRSLLNLGDLLEEQRYLDYADRYLEFFFEQYIAPDGFVARNPLDFSGTDIHACAEALLILATIWERSKLAARHMERITRFVLETFSNEDGSFAWRCRVKEGDLLVSRLPMIRWSQGWMIKALAHLERRIAR